MALSLCPSPVTLPCPLHVLLVFGIPIPIPIPVPTHLPQTLHAPVCPSPHKLSPASNPRATWQRRGDIPCVTRARQAKLNNPKENSGAQQRGSSSEEPLKWPAVDKARLVMRPPPSPERAGYCHIMALRVAAAPRGDSWHLPALAVMSWPPPPPPRRDRSAAAASQAAPGERSVRGGGQEKRGKEGEKENK